MVQVPGHLESAEFFVEYRKRAAGQPRILHRKGCTDIRKTSSFSRIGGTLSERVLCKCAGYEGLAEAEAILEAEEQASAVRAAQFEQRKADSIARYELLLAEVQKLYPRARLEAWWRHGTDAFDVKLRLGDDYSSYSEVEFESGGNTYSNIHVRTAEDIKRLAALVDVIEQHAPVAV
jgi:hypothetical protein